MHVITQSLFAAADEKYRAFAKKIVSDTHYEMIGVKMPAIKKIVKDSLRDNTYRDFLAEKHVYYEELMVHGLIVSTVKDETFFTLLNEFLPLIDNWAVCDSVAAALKPQKNKAELLSHVYAWLGSTNVYAVRFAIVCILDHFCDKDRFDENIAIVKSIKSDEYYINMALAWLISVMLVKDCDRVLPLLEERSLPPFLQNKAIDKARDSFRIDEKLKIYLKTLKV